MEQKNELRFYFAYGERYNSMAQGFYSQYKDACNHIATDTLPKDLLDTSNAEEKYCFMYDLKENSAICAIIFEALAIEAYVNFWGANLLGDDVFYTKYEPSKAERLSSGRKDYPRTTLDKIKLLCKEECDTPYPTDKEHFRMLKQLFEDRDRLVHYKPRGHLLSRPNPNQIYTIDMEKEAYAEYISACDELNFIFENIDRYMHLYQELKDNLQKCSNKPDPYLQMIADAIDAIYEETTEMFRKCSLKDVKK